MTDQKNSRVKRRKEKRKNKKLFSFIAGILIAVVLLWAGNSVIGNDEPESGKERETDSTVTEKDEEKDSKNEQKTNGEPVEDKDEKTITEKTEDEEESEEYVIEGSSDDNVSRVVKKDWETIDTEQDTSDRHRATFDKGSKDWEEILKAVSVATELKQDDMITWRVENGGGPQLVSAVVSDSSQDNVYRVLVEWQKKEGYKPVQLEILKDNPYK